MMKILSAKDVAKKTSLSVPHIRRAAKAHLFPAPIKLSESRLGWLEEEIDTWLKQTVLSAREGN
jgi:predicted DNA-binding transcriptional regulator AlpA